MKKLILLMCICIITFSLSGCVYGDGEGTTHEIEDDTSYTITDDTVEKTGGEEIKASEDYFEWVDDYIVGLTDSGKTQTEIVIPERCVGFNTALFIEEDNVATTVTFESHDDIDLSTAFFDAQYITSVSLPLGLTTIPSMSFGLCDTLETITIPHNVTTIEQYAFEECTSLHTVIINGDITSIGQNAFDGCSAITTLNLPNSIESIEKYAFYQCDSLTSITLPSSLTSIGEYAFADGGITEITAPADLELTSFDSTAFIQLHGEVVTVYVTEGSWIDTNFWDVFESGMFEKTYA